MVLVSFISHMYSLSRRICLSRYIRTRNFSSCDRLSSGHFFIREAGRLFRMSSRILLFWKLSDSLLCRYLLTRLCFNLHSMPSRLLLSFNQFVACALRSWLILNRKSAILFRCNFCICHPIELILIGFHFMCRRNILDL